VQCVTRGVDITTTPTADPDTNPVNPLSASDGGHWVTSASETMKLTPTEIAQCRKENHCFHSNYFYTNGHMDICKRFFNGIVQLHDIPCSIISDRDLVSQAASG
jgi:hypothetical protein